MSLYCGGKPITFYCNCYFVFLMCSTANSNITRPFWRTAWPSCPLSLSLSCGKWYVHGCGENGRPLLSSWRTMPVGTQPCCCSCPAWWESRNCNCYTRGLSRPGHQRNNRACMFDFKKVFSFTKILCTMGHPFIVYPLSLLSDVNIWPT